MHCDIQFLMSDDQPGRVLGLVGNILLNIFIHQTTGRNNNKQSKNSKLTKEN